MQFHHPSRTLPLWVWPWWGLQFVLICVIIGLLRNYLRSYYYSQIKPRPGRTIADIPPVPEREAYDLQRLAGRIRLSAKEARIFALAILEPAELRQRVAEHYIPAQRTLRQEVTIESQIPSGLLALKDDPPNPLGADNGRNTILLPVLVIPKGALNDNLEVYAADSTRIPLLSYREYLQLTAGILRVFLCMAYGLSTKERRAKFPQPTAGTAKSDVLHLEQRALCEIIRRAQANKEVKKTLGVSPVTPEANDVAKLLEDLPVEDNRKVYLQLAAAWSVNCRSITRSLHQRPWMRMVARSYAIAAR